MKVSVLVKDLQDYIKEYGDNELIFNIPTILNAYEYSYCNTERGCYLELTEVKIIDNDFIDSKTASKIEDRVNYEV